MIRRTPLAITAVIALGFHPAGLVAQDREGADGLRLNPLSSLDPADVSRFRDAPLFTPSRRPPPVARPRPETAPAITPVVRREPPKLRLTGIIQGSAAPSAVLQRSDQSTTTVRIGDDVDGWLVTAIDSVAIRLRSGAHEQEYKLFGQDALAADRPEAAAPVRAERRINHPPVDLGANIRAKPPAQP